MLATLDIRAAGHFLVLDAAVGPSIWKLPSVRPIRAQSRHPQLMTLDSVAASRDQKHFAIQYPPAIAITDLRSLYALWTQAPAAYCSSLLSLYWLSRITQLLLYFFCSSSRHLASNAVTRAHHPSLLSQRYLDKPQFSAGAGTNCDTQSKSVDEGFYLAGPATKTSFVPGQSETSNLINITTSAYHIASAPRRAPWRDRGA